MDYSKHAEAIAGLRAMKHKLQIYWTLYQDWLLGERWGRVLLLALLVMLLGGIVMLPGVVTLLVLISLVVKLVGGIGNSRPAALPDHSQDFNRG